MRCYWYVNPSYFKNPGTHKETPIMRMRLTGAVVLFAAAMGLVSCGTPSTPDFVQKAAMSDMYEVQAGQIASQKGGADAVKQFGEHMVDAHTQTTNELKEIVKAENIKVDLPSSLDDSHKKLIDDLNAASGDDFDKTYADQQVKAHKQAVDLFESYAKNGDNAAVKQFASKTLPVIKQHLSDAKTLAK
jgi:putative membrane protein